MISEFTGGFIIGILVALFLFFLFRDLLLRMILKSAVPMIKDNKTGDIMEFEEFKEDALKNIETDLIYSYKLLMLLKTTIALLLEKEMLGEDEIELKIKEVLQKKQLEIIEAVEDYRNLFAARGIDIDSILNNSKEA